MKEEILNEKPATYYVRFRHIPFELRFTPIYLIAIENIQVDTGIQVTEYELQCAVCDELEMLNYQPEDIKIESSQLIKETA